MKKMRRAGLEPARPKAGDFKSPASTIPPSPQGSRHHHRRVRRNGDPFYERKRGWRDLNSHGLGLESSQRQPTLIPTSNAPSGTRTHNQRLRRPLLVQLSFQCESVPDKDRTCDLPLRRRSLYPTELRAHDADLEYCATPKILFLCREIKKPATPWSKYHFAQLDKR